MLTLRKIRLWFRCHVESPACAFIVFTFLCVTSSGFAAEDGKSVPMVVTKDDPKHAILRMPEVDIFDAIAIFEKLSGKNVIVPMDTVKTGKISLMAPEALSIDQAIQMISSALLINGYALVPGDGNRVKLVSVASANPRAMGLPIYSGPADGFPKDCPILTYFMPFKYLPAKDALTILTQQVALNAPYGAIVAAPNAQALLITESAGVIRQLIGIQKLIDVPPSEMGVEFVQLHNANAPAVVETVKTMLNVGAGVGTGGNESLKMSLVGNSGEKASTGLIKMDGSERLLADPRTNRVLVVASKSSMALLLGIIKKLDETAAQGEPKEYRLRFVAASELLPILVNALAEQGDGNAATSGAPPSIADSGGTGGGFGGSGSGGMSSMDVSEQVHVSEEKSRAVSQVVGKTKLIADNRSNTMVVIGPPHSWEVAERILKIMDQPPKQVYLATVIGQMSNNGFQELGIDILQQARGGSDNYAASMLNNFSLSGPANPKNILVNGTALATAALPGYGIYGTVGNLLNYYVKLLQNTTRFTILSRPSVYTSNNKKAIIASGVQQPVPGTSQSNVVGGTSTNNTSTVLNTSVEYKNVLLQLAVVPLINANNDVTLQIAQSNDTLGNTVAIGTVNATAISKQFLNTSITVRNGETVVIGGLLTESDNVVKVGIPFLSDIPLIGSLFSDTQQTKVKTELVIMIQPNVISSLGDVRSQSEYELDRTKVGEKALKMMDTPPSSIRATPVPESDLMEIRPGPVSTP